MYQDMQIQRINNLKKKRIKQKKKDKIESIITFGEEKEMNKPIIKRTSDTTLRRGAALATKKNFL